MQVGFIGAGNMARALAERAERTTSWAAEVGATASNVIVGPVGD
jgi:pyrroline-5-carboxylate reductase